MMNNSELRLTKKVRQSFSLLVLIMLLVGMLQNGNNYGRVLAAAQKGAECVSVGAGGGGYITAVKIVPAGIGGKQLRTIYATSDVGGFFRSVDDGQSWQICNKGINNRCAYDLDYDPKNPNIVYIATYGGVYKSIDAGQNWVLKRNGFPDIDKWNISEPLAAIVVDPNNSNIIFAGVRERWLETSYNCASSKGRIYKSSDAGETWTRIDIDKSAKEKFKVAVYKIAIQQGNSNIIYLATDKGMFKSLDGGSNWDPINKGLPNYAGSKTQNSPFVVSAAIDPSRPEHIYCVVRIAPTNSVSSKQWNAGVWESTNGGLTWSAKNIGLGPTKSEIQKNPSGDLVRNYWPLAIDPTDPSKIYLGAISWLGAGVWKTADGGSNWLNTFKHLGDDILSEFNVDMYPDGKWTGGGKPIAISIDIDKTDPNVIYFSNDMMIYKTLDGGNSWHQSLTDRVGNVPDAKNRYYWRNRGFDNTVVKVVKVDPNDSNRVYIGAYDAGFLKSEDGAQSFKMSNAMAFGRDDLGSCFAIAIDAVQPNIIYASFNKNSINNGVLAKSIDYGETWEILNSKAKGLINAQIRAIAIDENSNPSARTIYVASKGRGIYKTGDGGINWQLVFGSGEVTEIKIDPSNPQVVYAGVEAKNGLGGLYKSTDAGRKWVRVGGNWIASVGSIVINQSNPNTLHVGTIRYFSKTQNKIYLGGIYRSDDAGMNWRNILESSDINADEELFSIEAMAISDNNPDIVYAGATDYPFHDEYSSAGLIVSGDGGVTWQQNNNELPNPNISCLTISEGNVSCLYVATLGNGVFRCKNE